TFLSWPTSLHGLSVLGLGVRQLFSHPGGLVLPVLGVALVILGIAGDRDRRAHILIALSPLIPAAVSSMLGLYPWGPLLGEFPSGRLLMFALPSLMLGIAGGIGVLYNRNPLIGTVAAAAITSFLIIESVGTVVEPRTSRTT